MSDVEHLTCQELVEILTDYLEGAIEPELRAEIERHLIFCRGCANYVEQMHSTIDLLGRLAAADEADGHASADVLTMFRTWKVERET